MATILFVSEFCLLDRKSGAALSARAMLEALAAAGHECHAVTLSIFDGHDESAVPEAFSAPAGRSCLLMRDGVSHIIHRTLSSRIEALRPWDRDAYLRLALDEIARRKPDLVLTYGGMLLWPVLRFAQMLGARTVFYLANASWAEREDAEIRHIDDFIMPSRTLADYFCEKKGVPRERVRVVRDIVDPFPAPPSSLENIAARQDGHVTMVNPQPGKGGAFFLHLVAAARSKAPDIRFMAVEGRWGRGEWENLANIGELSNLRWHPTTEDMASVYRQSALLLMPTLLFEASGRVIPEAMQAGLPVLAMDRGGVAEQLDGGGFLFDCPEELIADPFRAPAPAVLDHWLHFIRTLMSNEVLYTRAVRLALAAGERARPDLRRREAVEAFEALLAVPPALPADVQPEVHRTLIDMRVRLQGLLDRGGEEESMEEPAQGGPPTGLDRHPYREALRFSLGQPAVRDAVRLLQRGEHDAAQDGLERYARAMPMDYQALLLLADLLARQGNLLLAQALARRAADLAPAAAEPWQALSRYLAAAGEDDEALSVSSDVVARFPDQPELLAIHARRLNAVRRQHELGEPGNHDEKRAGTWSSLDPARASSFGQRMKSLFTRDFFDARDGAGHSSDAPIFVLGADPAAVAHVERHLAGQDEIPMLGPCTFLPRIAGHLGELNPLREDPPARRSLLNALSGQEVRLLAQAYLDRVVARLGHLPPRFIDAQPHNWAFVGLIRLLFPEARIVHVIGSGDPPALADCCADLIGHFDCLAPGVIHHVRPGDDIPLLASCGAYLAEVAS